MIQQILKRVLSVKWQRNLVYFRDLSERMDLIEATADRAIQGLGALVLGNKVGNPGDATSLEQSEFRIRSQWGEDGILHHIFSQIGIVNRTFVEFGIQAGRECNAAHLALSARWHGLFIEGDPRLASWAEEYYARMLGANSRAVKVVCSFITADNINKILSTAGIKETIDLLSIDIDGNDYWIWRAISAVVPRVVVIEYNAAFGSSDSITIPYEPSFRRSSLGDGMYYGVSLNALAKLADRKGYALVGCGSNGINAFFVRRELLRPPLREVPVAEAFRPHYGLSRHLSPEQQLDLVRGLPLVHVQGE